MHIDAGAGRLFKIVASDGEYLCVGHYYFNDLQKNVLKPAHKLRGLGLDARIFFIDVGTIPMIDRLHHWAGCRQRGGVKLVSQDGYQWGIACAILFYSRA